MESILHGLSMKFMARKKTLFGLAMFGFLVFFGFQALPFFSHFNLYFHTAPCSSQNAKELQQLFEDVETFVLFTGHARSGHSIVGAMLDAHPQMIVAHEFNIPENWEEIRRIAQHEQLTMKNAILQQLMESSCSSTVTGNRKAQRENEEIYNYYIPGQWQGNFKERIKVIGDKKGSYTAATMLSDPGFFKRLQNVVGVPLKFIHVVRNPFDNIATMVLRRLDSRFEAENKQVNDTKLLNVVMRYFMEEEEGSARIRPIYPVLDVPSHHVVLRTKKTLLKICEFLQVTCTEDYLEACASIVHPQVSVTRNRVVWTDEQKRWLLNEMQKYSYLKHFTFEDYPE